MDRRDQPLGEAERKLVADLARLDREQRAPRAGNAGVRRWLMVQELIVLAAFAWAVWSLVKAGVGQ
jgi:hypothetical protein